MKKILYPAIFLFIALTSCTPRITKEINALQHECFDPLILEPSCEVHGMRIDIIRNTEEVKVNDSTTKTEDVDYHPMGFDLGNGIFYDRNHNLTLRIDYLTNTDPQKDFTIIRSGYPHKKRHKKAFHFHNDTMSYQYKTSKAEKNQYVINNYPDSLVKSSKNLLSEYVFRYAITQDNGSWNYRGKRRIYDRIIQDGDGDYHVNRFIKKGRYTLQGDTIILARNYVVALSNDKKRITIFSHRRNGNHHLLYTIEKSNDKVIIYNKRQYGKTVQMNNNRVSLISNKREVRRWETR